MQYYAVYSNTSFLMTTEYCTGFKPPGLYQEIYLNIKDKNLTNIYVANCTGQVLLNNSCALENVFQAHCVDAEKMAPKQPVLHDTTNKKCVLACPPPYVNESFQCVLGCADGEYTLNNSARCLRCETAYDGGWIWSRETGRCVSECEYINSTSGGKICERLGNYCLRYYVKTVNEKDQKICVSDCASQGLVQSMTNV